MSAIFENACRGYTLSRYLSTLLDAIVTRLFNKPARLIRRPIQLRYQSCMSFGKNFTTGRYCRLECFPQDRVSLRSLLLNIGENCQINDFVHIAAARKVVIGNNVLIASRVFISDHNHGHYKGGFQTAPDVAPAQRDLSFAAVVIEDNVWLGEGVAVLPGVTIGYGSIVGANSVVTCDIPPNSIYAGVPAKCIKVFDHQRQQWVSV